MKIDIGFLPNFEIKPENPAETIWLGDFISKLHKVYKGTLHMKTFNKAFRVRMPESCVKVDKEGKHIWIGHITISEYARDWSKVDFPESLIFDYDF